MALDSDRRPCPWLQWHCGTRSIEGSVCLIVSCQIISQCQYYRTVGIALAGPRRAGEGASGAEIVIGRDGGVLGGRW